MNKNEKAEIIQSLTKDIPVSNAQQTSSSVNSISN